VTLLVPNVANLRKALDQKPGHEKGAHMTFVSGGLVRDDDVIVTLPQMGPRPRSVMADNTFFHACPFPATDSDSFSRPRFSEFEGPAGSASAAGEAWTACAAGVIARRSELLRV
jgi:hypothetical protein